MEQARPDRAPGFRLIYGVGILTAMTVTFQFEAFNAIEDVWRRKEKHQYWVLGLLWFLTASAGSFTSHTAAAKAKSVTKAAGGMCLLTVPFQIFVWYFQRYANGKIDTLNFVGCLTTLLLAGYGIGGLLALTCAYVGKFGARSIPPGLTFGYLSLALSTQYIIKMGVLAIPELAHHFTLVGCGLSFLGGVGWLTMKEKKTGELRRTGSDKQQAIFKELSRFAVFANVIACFEWCLENCLEDMYQDGVTVDSKYIESMEFIMDADLIYAGSVLAFVGALSGSILFGFGFDNKPRQVIKIWGVLAFLASVFYVCLVHTRNNQLFVWTVLFMSMCHRGAQAYFLAWATIKNKGNQLTAVCCWVSLYFCSEFLVFILFEMLESKMMRFAVLLIFTLGAVGQSFTYKFTHKLDTQVEGDAGDDESGYGALSDEEEELEQYQKSYNRNDRQWG